jgi:hypothetical protein
MAEKIDLVQGGGLETINGWISGVTREPFLTERSS